MSGCTLGVDLGIRAAHVATLCDERGEVIWSKRRFRNRHSELGAVVDQIGNCDELTVVMEPTRNAWVPVAAHFMAVGEAGDSGEALRLAVQDGLDDRRRRAICGQGVEVFSSGAYVIRRRLRKQSMQHRRSGKRPVQLGDVIEELRIVSQSWISAHCSNQYGSMLGIPIGPVGTG